MLIIGLTGGIGSGKSIVARHFENLGVPVIDADAITRELVEPGRIALEKIVTYFGSDILQADGKLDRKQLRDRIFTNPDDRKILEGILHPLAQKEVQQRIVNLNAPYCIVSVPLLIESGWSTMVDRILVVDSPRELQIQRTMARDGTTRQQVEAIIDSQVDRKTRLAAANDILENTSDIAYLFEQVNILNEKYLNLARADKYH
jgi:dephospho-CoA kinase